MIVQPLRVSTTGAWSPRQAHAVIAAVADEARARGLRFTPVNITTMGGPERVLICAICIAHDEPVPLDAACPRCL